MGSFVLDIKGQLNNIRLNNNKVLWPLFEAVVNSIHAIDDSPNCDKGKIIISALREKTEQIAIKDTEVLGHFKSFIIEDNGVGFNEENYKSFNTAYSTFKIKKGCKGIGRFLWLKAFESVFIESTFYDKGCYFDRRFNFTTDGIDPDENISASSGTNCGTRVTLSNLKNKFYQSFPIELDVIAKKIIEHCLMFFISGKCPHIILKDGTSFIDLNEYFDKNIKDSLHQDPFTIKDVDFTLFHLRLPEGATAHSLHLCANLQEVSSVELKKYIPDLQKKINIAESEYSFYYVGYISSPYLDSIVNNTRTAFEFDETDDQISISGTGRDTIISTAIEYIKAYLSEYIEDIAIQKRKQIDNFANDIRPTYKYLLSKCPEIYDQIPAGLNEDNLELELHKAVQKWETNIKVQGMKLNAEAKKSVIDEVKYQDLFEQYWSGVTDISKTYLAEYVTRRKTLLSLLNDALTIQENGRFKKEDIIHSLICPMQHTSNDIEFEEMNLWIIDERLAYHKYLASDKTLKSMPVVNSNSTKEPDIAVFNQAFAYSDSDEPFSAITIIEFKKPDNDTKNPFDQVGDYIDLIRSGKKKRTNGQSFNVTEGTVFRCYVICDLTDRMRKHCLTSVLYR